MNAACSNLASKAGAQTAKEETTPFAALRPVFFFASFPSFRSFLLSSDYDERKRRRSDSQVRGRRTRNSDAEQSPVKGGPPHFKL